LQEADTGTTWTYEWLAIASWYPPYLFSLSVFNVHPRFGTIDFSPFVKTSSLNDSFKGSFLCLYWPPDVLLQQANKMQKRSLGNLRAHQPDYWGRRDLIHFHTKEMLLQDRTSTFILQHINGHPKSSAGVLIGCVANSTPHPW